MNESEITTDATEMVNGIFAVGSVSAIMGKPMLGASYDLECFRWKDDDGDDLVLVVKADEDMPSSNGWVIICDVRRLSDDQVLKLAGFCKIREYAFHTGDLDDLDEFVCEDCRESTH